jgi:hypothetical protein
MRSHLQHGVCLPLQVRLLTAGDGEQTPVWPGRPYRHAPEASVEPVPVPCGGLHSASGWPRAITDGATAKPFSRARPPANLTLSRVMTKRRTGGSLTVVRGALFQIDERFTDR